MLIIAHRGASGYAPENTIAAMALGIKQGCHGIELDVQLTKDGQVVVFHDWTVERTTNGTGAIRDLTLEEIKRLDGGAWYSDKYKGEKVPTLEEVFQFVPNTLFLNVEMKAISSDERELAEKVAELIEKYERVEHTVVSSFNHLCLKKIQTINPQIKIAALYEAHLLNPIHYFQSNGLELYSFHPCHYYVTSEMIEDFHRNNMKVYSWTVNEVEKGRHLQEIGIDGIITNFPDLFVTTMQKISNEFS